MIVHADMKQTRYKRFQDYVLIETTVHVVCNLTYMTMDTEWSLHNVLLATDTAVKCIKLKAQVNTLIVKTAWGEVQHRSCCSLSALGNFLACFDEIYPCPSNILWFISEGYCTYA